MKLNLQSVEISLDIKGERKQTQDLREQFANLLFQRGTGMIAHALAHKIYESPGEIELGADEARLVEQIANTCPAMFAAAILAQLKNQ